MQKFVLLIFSIFLFGSCISSQLQQLTLEEQFQLDELESLYKTQQSDFDLLLRLGILYHKASMYEKAIEVLTNANGIRTMDPRITYYLGSSLELSGQLEKAADILLAYEKLPANQLERLWIEGRYLLVNRKIAQQEMAALLDEYRKNETLTTINNSIVFLPLVYLGENKKFAAYRHGLTELIIRDLKLIDELFVTDRSRVASLQQEMNRAGLDSESRESISLIGNIFNSRIVVRGAYNVLNESQVIFDLATWDLLNEDVPKSQQFTGDQAEIFRIKDDLVFALLAILNFQISEELADLITLIPTEDHRTLLAFSAGLQKEDEGQYDAAAVFFRKALEFDPEFTPARERIAPLEALATTLQQPYDVIGTSATGLKSSEPGRASATQ